MIEGIELEIHINERVIDTLREIQKNTWIQEAHLKMSELEEEIQVQKRRVAYYAAQAAWVQVDLE